MTKRAGWIAVAVTVAATHAAAARSLDDLREGQTLHGFRADAVYLDGSGGPMGARLVHARTGFTLDLLRMETAPQGYVWVNTFLVSDMGEPHTQEHLLLGKGNVGRAVANLQSYSLVSSSAFVSQWRTQYHFNAPAGSEVFFRVLGAQLHALLYPDYSDAEIRREVRNIGVAEDPDGSLRLEEKGTVYQEMVSAFERPGSRLFRTAGHLLYGEDHPLAMSAGGWPAAIRSMTPGHVRDYHDATHHLGNMGMIAALPRSEALDDVLTRTGRILDELHRPLPESLSRFPTEADLPAPRWHPEAEVRSAEYPHGNPEEPSPLLFAWRPERALALRDEILLELFLANFAGDATTNLYRIFIDGETREIELGAQRVAGWMSSDPGHPVYVQLSDVAPARATPARLEEARARIQRELQRIAAWEDGAAELHAFNRRLSSRVIEMRREISNFASTPPGFGQRGTRNHWINHLHRLAGVPGFRKSVTLQAELDEIEQRLQTGENIWQAALARWALLDATPYVIMARPSPALIEAEERERRARLQAELDRLMARLDVPDTQQAIRLYQAEYDRETAQIEALEANTGGRFLDDPPLSLDPLLDYRIERIAGVPVVRSRIEGLPSATAGLALALDAVPQDELLFLALLPALLTQVGVVDDGVVIPHAEVRERIRREILALNADHSTNPHSGRVELIIRGAGNDADEAARAFEWMAAMLYGPDWRPENLPRIRDVVDQGIAALRSTTARAEETWVDDPANAYRFQTDPLFLATASFQTRLHLAHRLRWQLREAPAAESDGTGAALAALADAGADSDRPALRRLLQAMQHDPATALPAAASLGRPATALLQDVARDLEVRLADLPDGALQRDFTDLVTQIRADLGVPAAVALERLDRTRQRLLSRAGARSFLVAAPAVGESLEPALAALFAGLEDGERGAAERPSTPIVLNRLLERTPDAGPVHFVGLVNPNTQGGVFLNSVPMASYRDIDRDRLLDFLAAQLYSGGGAHSMFMKTWAAGLAYSNGLRNSPATGLLTYYAERVPELPQTLRFVIDELRAVEPDPALTEYAVAMAFRGIRSAHPYEARAEAMADDIADGLDPGVVQAFLGAVLARRDEPSLAEALFGRLEGVYGQVLPGYGPDSADVEDGVFFVIGPESQLRLYEAYLRTAEGSKTRLHRLYPRDFWIVE